MPVPYDETPTPTVITDPQHSRYLREREPWAIAHERRKHEEAIFKYGEYCVIVLMWRVEDHTLGLVDRCPACFEAYDPTTSAYGQGTSKICPECYGSFYEGGYKARIIRPTLWDVNEPANEEARRGEIHPQVASVQSTWDFRLRKGDYIFRGDGTRWQVQTFSTNHLRTGFGIPSTRETALGWNVGNATREDDASPAFIIPPPLGELMDWLATAQCERWPIDKTPHQDIRGPLL